jgi:protein subunit release factor B
MSEPVSIQSAKDAFERRMKRLGVREADLSESFTRSSGPGGQNVNKVSTAVTLVHAPTGVAVTVQDSRSQSWNRRLARERLLDELEKRRRDKHQARRAEAALERRRNSPRPRGLKQRILESKKRRGNTKKMRGRVDE